jgi:hypothetical protein
MKKDIKIPDREVGAQAQNLQLQNRWRREVM